jgi:hypothetical protein
VHPCQPARIPATVAEVLAALQEGMCPVCHSGLEPGLAVSRDQRAGVCHGCCPCTLWTWSVGLGPGIISVGRGRRHVSEIPEGEHC